jgi:hypothetical protein
MNGHFINKIPKTFRVFDKWQIDNIACLTGNYTSIYSIYISLDWKQINLLSFLVLTTNSYVNKLRIWLCEKNIKFHLAFFFFFFFFLLMKFTFSANFKHHMWCCQLRGLLNMIDLVTFFHYIRKKIHLPNTPHPCIV